MGRRALLLAATATLVGCEPSPPSTPSTATRDSAGVAIVENPDVAGLPVHAVPESPAFRIGWAPDDPPLEWISSGVLLPDGGAAFTDAQAARVYLVDAAGEVEAFGRRGEGPGEFDGPASILLMPDGSLGVWDGGLSRFSRFTVRGEFLDSDPVPAGGLLSFDPRGIVGGHALGWVPTSISFLPGQGESGWFGGPLVLRDLETLEADSVGEAPLVLVEMEGGRPNANPFSYFGSGDVYDGGFVWGTNDDPQLRWIGVDGTVERVARWVQEPVVVDDRVRQRYTELTRAQNASHPRPLPDDVVEKGIRDALSVAPSELPYFRLVHATRDGAVWVGAYELSTRYASRFLVIDSSGRTLRRVSFPRPIRLLDVSADRVIGVEVDEFEIQSVAIYRVDG